MNRKSNEYYELIKLKEINLPNQSKQWFNQLDILLMISDFEMCFFQMKTVLNFNEWINWLINDFIPWFYSNVIVNQEERLNHFGLFIFLKVWMNFSKKLLIKYANCIYDFYKINVHFIRNFSFNCNAFDGWTKSTIIQKLLASILNLNLLLIIFTNEIFIL